MMRRAEKEETSFLAFGLTALLKCRTDLTAHFFFHASIPLSATMALLLNHTLEWLDAIASRMKLVLRQ